MSSLFHLKNKPSAWDSLNESVYALGWKMLSLSRQPKSVALCWLSEKVMRRSLVCTNTNRPSQASSYSGCTLPVPFHW